MMKTLLIILINSIIINTANAQQRIISECTITYDIFINDTTTNKEQANILKQASKTVYIKGNNARVDLSGATFKQTLLYNKNTSVRTVLRELGNNKFISTVQSDEMSLSKKKLDTVNQKKDTTTKMILGYKCKKAVLRYSDTSSMVAYFALNLMPSVRDYEGILKDIPGFVLQYELIEKNGTSIGFTANKISFSPVMASKFELPKEEYRLLN